LLDRPKPTAGQWKKKMIVLCGELALEEAVDLSWDRLRADDVDDTQ
jgi:hypothetical protein